MKKILVVLAVVSMSGCAVQKQWIPTEGSRADGSVTLSFEYGGFEAPSVDNEHGKALAKQKCVAWGYTDAEPFGGVYTTCVVPGSSGCNRYRATSKYQCLGNLK